MAGLTLISSQKTVPVWNNIIFWWKNGSTFRKCHQKFLSSTSVSNIIKSDTNLNRIHEINFESKVHGRLGRRSTRPESVRDLIIFVGPGPVRGLRFFSGPYLVLRFWTVPGRSLIWMAEICQGRQRWKLMKNWSKISQSWTWKIFKSLVR